MRDGADAGSAACSAPAAPGHLGVAPACSDEDKLLGVKGGHPVPPFGAGAGAVRAPLLGRDHSFFARDPVAGKEPRHAAHRSFDARGSQPGHDLVQEQVERLAQPPEDLQRMCPKRHGAPLPTHRQRRGTTVTRPNGRPPNRRRARAPHPATGRAGRQAFIQSSNKPLTQISRIRFPIPAAPLPGSQHEAAIRPV
jgi:hypothetical protein